MTLTTGAVLADEVTQTSAAIAGRGTAWRGRTILSEAG
jgi:hypothetical protein